MRADELMAMMELEAGERDKAAAGSDPIAGGSVVADGVAAANHVIRLDKWGMRRGMDLVGDNDIRQAIGLPVGDEDDEGNRPAPPVACGKEPTADERYWADALADFHGAAYEPTPELNEKCVDGLRNEFVKNLMDTPEFEQIRASTMLNPTAAEIAVSAFAKQFGARREEAKRDAAQKGTGKGPRGKGKAGPGDGDGEIQTMKAAAKAVATAAKDVQDFKDACDACGLGDGAAGSKLDAKRVAGIHKRVRASQSLKKIAQLAGRFRRLAQSKQRMKVAHGADEVIGITLSGELGRLIPAELMKLADEDLELNTLRRVVESQTLAREMKATEPAGRGPIVVTVDESGSMSGAKVETAKALALALAWVAKKQRRWCALVGFSGGCTIEPGSLCLLPPGKWDEVALLEWLEHFYGGGTTMDVPLREVPGMWAEFVKRGMARGKTDIVMITDAEVNVPEEIRRSFLGFKAAEKVRLTTLVVQGTPGNISCVSDEVYETPAITTDSDAVGKVLSL